MERIEKIAGLVLCAGGIFIAYSLGNIAGLHQAVILGGRLSDLNGDNRLDAVIYKRDSPNNRQTPFIQDDNGNLLSLDDYFNQRSDITRQLIEQEREKILRNAATHD